MNIQSAILKHCERKTRKPKSYRKYGDRIENPVGELIFRDNGGKILFVGHLDTVEWRKPKVTRSKIAGCPQLDDRLGVAIGLELLGSIVSEPFDVLLTDKEEIGQSTASRFDAPHDYRWVVEFDRAGSDCVLYDYEGGTLEDSLEECGIETGYGSFSDISVLDNLGVQCFNFGCGYHGQHTPTCYCNIAEVETQLARFAVWYKHHGRAEYPWDGIIHVPPYQSRHSNTWTRVTSPAPPVDRVWTPSQHIAVTSPAGNHRECFECGCMENLWLVDDYCVECGVLLDSYSLRKEG